MKSLIVLSAMGLAVAVGPVFAQDHVDLERTQIIGNRELPKVLYIVPWKKPTQGPLSGRPLTSVIDEAMTPLDHDVFRRQVQYDEQVQLRAKAAAVAAQAPAASK